MPSAFRTSSSCSASRRSPAGCGCAMGALRVSCGSWRAWSRERRPTSPIRRSPGGSPAVDWRPRGVPRRGGAVGEHRRDHGVASALIQAEAVDPDALRAIVTAQATDAVSELLRWPTGDFGLVEAANPDDIGVLIPTETLVSEAISRGAAWESLAEILPSPDVVLALRPVASRGGRRPQARRVVAGRPGRRAALRRHHRRAHRSRTVLGGLRAGEPGPARPAAPARRAGRGGRPRGPAGAPGPTGGVRGVPAREPGVLDARRDRQLGRHGDGGAAGSADCRATQAGELWLRPVLHTRAGGARSGRHDHDADEVDDLPVTSMTLALTKVGGDPSTDEAVPDAAAEPPADAAAPNRRRRLTVPPAIPTTRRQTTVSATTPTATTPTTTTPTTTTDDEGDEGDERRRASPSSPGSVGRTSPPMSSRRAPSRSCPPVSPSTRRPSRPPRPLDSAASPRSVAAYKGVQPSPQIRRPHRSSSGIRVSTAASS